MQGYMKIICWLRLFLKEGRVNKNTDANGLGLLTSVLFVIFAILVRLIV